MEQVPQKNSQVLKIYFFIITLDSISFGLIAPILAPLLLHPSDFFKNNHFSFFNHSLYGLLITLFPLAFMLGAPILGRLSDQLGRKKVLLFCLITMLLAFFSYTFSFVLKNIWLLMLARILAGLSASSQGIAQAAVAAFAEKTKKPQAISMMAVGMTSGLALGPFIASFWTPALKWLPFAVIIFLNCVAIFSLLIFLKNEAPIFKNKTSWKSTLHHPDRLKLLGIFLLFELGWSLFYQSIPITLNLVWHLQTQAIGLSLSFVGSMLALWLVFSIRVGLKITSLNKLVQLGFYFGIFALLLAACQFSYLSFLLFSIPIVFAVSLIYPAIISQLSETATTHEQGLMMGMTNALLAFSFAVTGMLSSFLAYIHSALPFLIAALSWTIACAWGFKYKKEIICNSVST